MYVIIKKLEHPEKVQNRGNHKSNCDDTKIQHFSGINKRLPFEDLDFYELFRITFEMSELGRMKRLLPLHEMAVNFGLVSNRKERRPKHSVREETTTLCSQKNIGKSIFIPITQIRCVVLLYFCTD